MSFSPGKDIVVVQQLESGTRFPLLLLEWVESWFVMWLPRLQSLLIEKMYTMHLCNNAIRDLFAVVNVGYVESMLVTK